MAKKIEIDLLDDPSDHPIRTLNYSTCDHPDTEVSIYAYVSDTIGGVRISEVSFTIDQPGGGLAGCSYMRSDNAELILLMEEFLLTLGVKPRRPKGWSSCINLHGEARTDILNEMGLKAAADREYQRQLEEEKDIPEEEDNE
jgi:hypothetical protein